MASNPSDDDSDRRAQAVNTLQTLGLAEAEAEAFFDRVAALNRLGSDQEDAADALFAELLAAIAKKAAESNGVDPSA